VGSNSRPIVPQLFVKSNAEKPKPTLPLGFIAERGASAVPDPWIPPKLDALGPILARPLPEEGLTTSSRPIVPQMLVKDTKELNATTLFGFVAERGPSALPTPWKPPKLDALGSILARPLPEEGLATSASLRSAVPHLTLAVKTEKAKPTTPFGFIAERGPSVQPSPWEPPKLEALGSIAERRPAKHQTNHNSS
jgi:hypothetical protein